MGWQWHQLNQMQIICSLLQRDNHASTSSCIVPYQSFCTDLNAGQSPRWMHVRLMLLISGALRTLPGIKWHQFVRNDKVRRITKQPNLTAIIHLRRLSMRGHIARMDDDADAKMILMDPPPENWKRPPGRPCITWLNTVQRDLRAYNLTLNEAVDLAQNSPLRRLMSTYGTTHS